MKNKINFIIPCAGYGTRLGIPFAKELFPIDKNLTLIDKLFSNIYEFREKSRVIIIISEHKTDLIKYLGKYKNDFDIIFLFQKYDELAGAIMSCENYSSSTNILLLPDIFIDDSDITKKINHIIIHTELQKVSYLAKKESDFNILTKVGALQCNENDEIISMFEKPQTNNNYNAYWVGIGFNNFKFIKNFIKFQKHQKCNEYYFKNKKAIFVDYALDLGVWENIRRFECDHRGQILTLK